MILDGGSCEFGIESTMINLPRRDAPRSCATASSPARCSRRRSALQCPTRGKDAPCASGRLKSHYAPRTKLELVSAEAPARPIRRNGRRPVAVMASGEVLDHLEGTPVLAIKAPADLHGYGRDLYENLHRLDRAGAERILVELPPQSPDCRSQRPPRPRRSLRRTRHEQDLRHQELRLCPIRRPRMVRRPRPPVRVPRLQEGGDRSRPP